MFFIEFLNFLQVRGILNKLTPEKFEKLINDVLNVGLDSSTILKGVIVLVSILKVNSLCVIFQFFLSNQKFVYFQCFGEFFH